MDNFLKDMELTKKGNENMFIVSSENCFYGPRLKNQPALVIDTGYKIINHYSNVNFGRIINEFYIKVCHYNYDFNFYQINEIVKIRDGVKLINILKHLGKYHGKGSIILYLKHPKTIEKLYFKSLWNNYPYVFRLCHVSIEKIVYNIKINTLKMILKKINYPNFPINDLAPLIHNYI